ncbi:SGNH/GDSL hydrolase family protein [Brucella gallinifaecis]|uniref:Hydrolase n=1 Tax=Brucella gallinifaecis TaxID=215590 RepID=A0A502BKT8_9HYPH|nr:SGNH/GDSL hydrolase family protein [Brucella gallinifaecis]TPF74271.1 hydrolase [Brucella gallinifaecis]
MTEAINILCFGDSNTYGTVPMLHAAHAERFGSDIRWTGVMRNKLGSGYHIIEEGLPGRTTVHDDAIEGASRNGKTYLLPCLHSHNPIDLIVLTLGTNDLKTRFNLTPEDIRRGLEALLDIIHKNPSGRNGAIPKLLIVAPTPIEEIGFLGEIFLGGAAKSRKIASKYHEVARASGASFLDAGSLIRVSNVDGVHFDAKQHEVLGKAISEKILHIVSTK